VLLRERLPEARILVLGLLPREEFPDASLRRAVNQVNSLIRYCADGEHIVYAEIGDVLLDSGGRLSSALSPDRLHFNERGYTLLASRLEPVLDRVLPGAGSCAATPFGLRSGQALPAHLACASRSTSERREDLSRGFSSSRLRP
jgi:GDSL-like Lipase/Acylhydrolase family